MIGHKTLTRNHTTRPSGHEDIFTPVSSRSEKGNGDAFRTYASLSKLLKYRHEWAAVVLVLVTNNGA